MIPVFKPLIEDVDLESAAEALSMGWLGMGSYVGAFERSLAGFLELSDDRHVVAVSTGHAALHLALLAVGVGPGDEVVTPAFNNVADFQAILACGATPVFCDIDDRTLCIDIDAAGKLIGPRTRAIIVMDYGCFVCDHDRIAKIANGNGLRVIHDAAHSLGSRHDGRMVGSFSDVTMFSFDPVKTITTVDGGALILSHPETAKQVQEMRLIGMQQEPTTMYQNQRAWTQDVARLGFRYHMANLHAALGLAQLGRFSEIATTRRNACVYYNEQLGSIPSLSVPDTSFGDVVPFLYYIRVPAGTREELRRHLHERGVETGIHWQPGHWFTLFQGCRKGDLAVTDRVGREIVTLPMHSKMSQDTQDVVIGAIWEFFGS